MAEYQQPNSMCRFSFCGRNPLPKIPDTNIRFESVIGDLAETRRKQIGLSKSRLVQKIGYKNIIIGCSNYYLFLAGDIEQSIILENLENALSLDPDEISSALNQTRQNIIEAKGIDGE